MTDWKRDSVGVLSVTAKDFGAGTVFEFALSDGTLYYIDNRHAGYNRLVTLYQQDMSAFWDIVQMLREHRASSEYRIEDMLTDAILRYDAIFEDWRGS